jgi:RHS repeat-associated protein
MPATGSPPGPAARDNCLNGKETGNGDKFVYDAEGQLTDAYYLAQIDAAGNVSNPWVQEHFHYDQLRNRFGSNQTVSHGTVNFTRKDNGLNQYKAWMPFSVTNYDDDIGGTWGAPGHANGVLMQDGNVTAGYNALNQATMIWSAGSGWTYFGYDPLGRCVKRWTDTVPATYFYYDGWNLVQEGPSGGSPARVYAHGARVDEVIASSNETGAVLFHHYDALGNCILLSDGAGNLFEQYDYEAFGKPYFYNAAGTGSPTSAWNNRFLFTGREYLSELKLYDYRNRMYQPELGRFMQPDPKHFAAGDYNLYRYCHNDPVNHSDPTGLQDEKPKEEKLVREVFKTTFSPTGSHLSYTVRYTESGNWLNTRIADHYKDGLKGGSTMAIGTAKSSGSDWNVDLHVDWFVGKGDKNSDVVTRELEHVQDFRDFSAAYARNLSSASPGLFPQQVETKFEESRKHYDGTIAQQKAQGSSLDKPHNLSMYPKQPATLPEFEDTASHVPYIPSSGPPY